MRGCQHAGVRSSTEESVRTCKAGALPMQAQYFFSSQAVRFQTHSTLFYTWIVVAHVRAQTIRSHQTSGHRARPQQSFHPRSQHHSRLVSQSRSLINYFYCASRVCYCFFTTSGSLEEQCGMYIRARFQGVVRVRALGRRRLPSPEASALRQQGAIACNAELETAK